jgi:DNA repair photolyase
MTSPNRHTPRKGRGAASNPAGRFEHERAEAQDDGWGILDEPLPALETLVLPEPAHTIITRNKSPDISFDRSINPYRGCEHGCVYCFARPAHSYVNLSPGLDFETKLFYKADAAKLLEKELAVPSYRCAPIAMGTNTDPYQPIERQYEVTRSILELLDRCNHPVTIVTKGAALIERDVELLGRMAARRLAAVAVSITTLRPELKRTLEPRAAGPATRLRAIRQLKEAGVPVTVMVAPLIPVLTDHEMEAILERAREAGAERAGYVLLRLPHEVKDLFREWLNTHEPLKAEHVMARVNDMRGGKDNDPRFGHRQRGEGVYADLLRSRFAAACRRLGFNGEREWSLDVTSFRPPRPSAPQLSLF